MWISLKLFLEIVIKRKSNSWDVRSFWSIVWNVIKSTRDCLKANNAKYCNDNCWILNVIFSSEIYRRLDFGINILDEPDEHISIQEIEVSFPTRKRRINDDLSEVDSNCLFPSWGSREKKSA